MVTHEPDEFGAKQDCQKMDESDVLNFERVRMRMLRLRLKG